MKSYTYKGMAFLYPTEVFDPFHKGMECSMCRKMVYSQYDKLKIVPFCPHCGAEIGRILCDKEEVKKMFDTGEITEVEQEKVSDQKTPSKNKCVVAGSFNPFTVGHLDMVKWASSVFDEVHILICKNTKKKGVPEDVLLVMKDAICDALKEGGVFNAKVSIYDGLVAKYCMDNGIKTSVRGLRNNMDFDYETNITLVNMEIHPELQTIYYPSKNAAISSSMVRELMAFRLDVSKYLPSAVYDAIIKNSNVYNFYYN